GALLASGRVLGVIELFVCGVITLALVIAAVIYVIGRRLRLEVRRRIQPPKVHVGTASRVDLSLTNRSTRRSPVLAIHDSVSGTHGAHLQVAPLRPGATARAAYRLPTSKRGLVTVGPLDVEITDPLGLSRTRLAAAGVSELMVYPKIYAVTPLPQSDSIDPYANSFQTIVLGRTGEDFHALREFGQGDDLRRVHWPSTARFDELMVRQEEQPSLGRVSIVIDNRSSAMSSEALDLAATIAGSVGLAAQGQHDLVRVIAVGSGSIHFANSNADVESILGHLAMLETSVEPDLLPTIQKVATHDPGGALVIVTCVAAVAESNAVRTLANRFASLTTVVIDPTTHNSKATSLALETSPRRVVVTADEPFPGIWNRTIGLRRRRPTGVSR
ncbi:MAG: DUF58 domain-containing protein, partial [Acidimicrobiales bacterium]